MTTYSVRGPHFRGPMTDTARLDVYEDGELVAEYRRRLANALY